MGLHLSQWMSCLKIGLYIFISISLAGCNYYRDKTKGELLNEETIAENEGIEVSYSLLRDRIFTPRCVSCHGTQGGISLESYNEVRKNLEAIRRTVVIEKSMPKGGALKASDRQLLEAWIQAGAPNERLNIPAESAPGTPPSGEAEPSPDEVAESTESSRPNPIPTLQAPPVAESKLTYQYVNREVLAPRCISCHGTAGGTNLQSYDNVKRNLKAIKRAVFQQRTMPQDGSLTSKQYSILSKWIALGAPKNGKVQSDNEPPGSSNETNRPDNPSRPNPPEETLPPIEAEVPLTATYESIKANILSKRCLYCHTENGSGKRIPLTPLEELLNSPLELVIPGNVEESGLVIAIERTDEKRMPPPGKGKPLKEEEIAMIKEWILNGAKD